MFTELKRREQFALDALGDLRGPRPPPLMSSKRTVNSSPPSRATVSAGRTQALSLAATASKQRVPLRSAQGYR